MFDWLEYDANKNKAFEEQLHQLQHFLGKYIEMNGKIRQFPIYDKPDQQCIDKIKNMPIPSKGRKPMEVGQELVEDVFNKSMLSQHPRFFSFVASAVSPYSIAGSILTDIYNINGCCWEMSPMAGMIEEKLISWMGSLAGYPENTRGGIFLSGGSISNMSAMVAARDSKLKPEEFGKGTIYLSDQAHSSNEKGLRIIGFRQDQIVKLPTDDNYRIIPDDLENAIKRDLAAGKKPFAIIGTMGSTNTGSIDPFEKIGEIAKKYNLWFHIDGAYGGSILVSPIYRNLAKGIELSDSFSWDTHKWLMQVYSCSILLVRDKQTLLNSFTEHPEYLADILSQDHNDGWDMGPEMSKPLRAIKLWYTIQATGTDMLAELIEYTFYNAKLVNDLLEMLPNWEIISPPSCGTINFRYHPEGWSNAEIDKLTKQISRKIIESGFAYIVTTTIKEKCVLRMCMINANSTEDDIRKTIEFLNRIAMEETEKSR